MFLNQQQLLSATPEKFDRTKLAGQSGQDLSTLLYTVISTLTWIVGFLAVIMLIYGGIRYMTAQGNDKNIVAARSTIMYAVVGLVITGIAASIQAFVLTNVTGTASDPKKTLSVILELTNNKPKCTDAGLSTEVTFVLKDSSDKIVKTATSESTVIKCADTRERNVKIFKGKFENLPVGTYKVCLENTDGKVDPDSCSNTFDKKEDEATEFTMQITNYTGGVKVIEQT